MNPQKNIILSIAFSLFFVTITPGIIKPPHLTKYTQDLIEKTKLGTIKERVLAIEECGVGRYSVCYYDLIELLKDDSSIIREKSAISLGMLRINSAVPHIEKALETEKETSVKIALIRSLGFLRVTDASALAAKYLENEDVKLRYAAAKVLTRNPNNELYDTIIARIQKENNDSVKILLLHAALKLKKTDPEIKHLVEYFYSPQRELRYLSSKAARDLKFIEFLQPLRKAISIEIDPDILDEFYQAYLETYYR